MTAPGKSVVEEVERYSHQWNAMVIDKNGEWIRYYLWEDERKAISAMMTLLIREKQRAEELQRKLEAPEQRLREQEQPLHVWFSSAQDPRAWEPSTNFGDATVVTCMTNADAKKAERIYNNILQRAERAEAALKRKDGLLREALTYMPRNEWCNGARERIQRELDGKGEGDA